MRERDEQTCRWWFSDEEFREALLVITRGDDVYGADVVVMDNERTEKEED